MDMQEELDKEYVPEIAQKLQEIFENNKDKRIVVVGTTCTGKSTLLQHLPEALDMDDLVFPLLTAEESDFVNQSPWTPEIGQTMIRLVREKVKVSPGTPVFGTVVIDSDLIIDLDISDELLKERTERRGADFEDAKNMQRQIKEEIKKAGIPSIELKVG